MDVVIVEDEPIFAMGLLRLLRDAMGINVVGHATSARAAFALVDEHKPNLVLLDIGLPGMDGFAAAREIRLRSPSTKLLILTCRRTARDVAEAVKAGASGFVVKTDAPDVLVEGLRKIAYGNTFFAPSLEPSALDVATLPEPRDAAARLSTREREVFVLLVAGMSNNQVAQELCISRKTLDTHRHHIYEKLGCHSLAELVRFAARNALLVEPGHHTPDGGVDSGYS